MLITRLRFSIVILSMVLLTFERSYASITPISKQTKTVAQDGSGDYTTVQSAINSIPNESTKAYVIFIKKGIYKELITVTKGRDFLMFKGEDPKNTILTFDNSARKLNANGKEFGTFGSASTYILADNFTAENITFENTSGTTGGQALAISISGDKAAFKNCRFLGHQDTFYAAGNTKQYLKNCFLAGTVDFIFGPSTAYFEDCTIHSLAAGYITAASTPQDQKYGYVFSKCKLTAIQTVPKNKVYLGRPWRSYSNVVFINSNMESHIRVEGWHNWGKAENEKTAFYAEYNSTGLGYQRGKRVGWCKELTVAIAKEYARKKVLGDWKPF